MKFASIKKNDKPGAQKVSGRAGHLRYFLIFQQWKLIFFAFFIKLIWLGVDFLNRTGTEIGHRELVWKNRYFLFLKKSKNSPSAQFWSQDIRDVNELLSDLEEKSNSKTASLIYWFFWRPGVTIYISFSFYIFIRKIGSQYWTVNEHSISLSSRELKRYRQIVRG